MADNLSPPTSDSYKTRVELSRDGQNTLYAEQARRQLKGERIILIDLASEILEAALDNLKKEHDSNPIG
jgi:DNA transposition AAA+ family ATPase